MSAMQVKITGPSGNAKVNCYGMFNMIINGHAFLFCLTNNYGATALHVSEYGSGLRWPVELDLADGATLGLASPPNEECPKYLDVLAIAKQKIMSDLIKRTSNGNGTEEDIARIILDMQKRYKTNELDF